MSFVSEALIPMGSFLDASGPLTGAPALPSSFRWRDTIIEIARVNRTWRSTKTDRGDVYLKRHWFDVTLGNARTAVIYFDRDAKRGASPWWLYSIAEPDG